MGRHKYILTNENGETINFDGIKNAAAYLDVAPSTIYIYSKNGKTFRGWKIEDLIVDVVTGKTKVSKVILEPRTKFKYGKWQFDKFFREGNVCCFSRAYHFQFDKNQDWEKLKEYLEKGVQIMVENDSELEDKYTLYMKTPRMQYTQYNYKTIKENLLYFELHVKFKEHRETFKEEINHLKEHINKIDKFVEDYERIREMERQESATDSWTEDTLQ